MRRPVLDCPSVPIGEGSVYHAELMTSDYVRLKFSLEEPLFLKRGAYFKDRDGLGKVCNGNPLGHFVLCSDYMPTYNPSTGGYDYDIQFDAWYYDWNRYVVKLNPKYGAQESSFSLTDTIVGHFNLLKKNIDDNYGLKDEDGNPIEGGTGLNMYNESPISCVVLYQQPTKDADGNPIEGVDNTLRVEQGASKVVSYDCTHIVDALSSIAEAFKCEWWVVNNVIYFGKCDYKQISEEEGYEWEFGKEMQNLTRSDSKDTYATRVYGFGSTRNISARYRKSLIFSSTLVGKGGGSFYYKSGGMKVEEDVPYLVDTHRRVFPYQFAEDLRYLPPAERKTLTAFSVVLKDSTRNYEASFTEYESVNTSTGETKKEPLYLGKIKAGKTQVKADFDIHVNGVRLVVNVGVNGYLDKDPEGTPLFSAMFPKTVGVESKEIVSSLNARGQDAGTLEFYSAQDVHLYALFNVSVVKGEGLEPLTFGSMIFNLQSLNEIVETYIQRLDEKNEVIAEYPCIINPKAENVYGNDASLVYTKAVTPSLNMRYQLKGLLRGKVDVSYFTNDLGVDATITDFEPRLMLPVDTCPNNYIDSEDIFDENGNVRKNRVVEAVVVADDIYPRKVVPIYAVQSFTDEVTDTTDESGLTMKTVTHYRIIIQKSEFFFSSDYYYKDETLSVKFQTGLLAGMEFELSNFSKDTKDFNNCQSYELTITDQYGIDLPNVSLYPQAGDKLVFFNYDTSLLMEEEATMVRSAEKELEDYIKDYIKKSAMDCGTYTATLCGDYVHYVDEGELDGDGEPVEKDRVFKLGDVIHLKHEGFFGDGERVSRIIGCEVKLDIPYDAPTYTVGESAAYSRLNELEGKLNGGGASVDIFSNAVIGSGGGVGVDIKTSTSSKLSTETNVYSSLAVDKHFMRKDTADNFTAAPTFNKGFKSRGDAYFGTFINDTSGAAIYQDADGNWHFEGDYLKIRKKIEAAEVEIMKTSHVGGRVMNTAANCKLDIVKPMPSEEEIMFYRCYFRAQDADGNRIDNLWQQYDQAYCETFNLTKDKGVTGNRYYWRLVVDVGSEIIDEEEFHFIDLSNIKNLGVVGAGYDGEYPSGSHVSAPAEGDAVVQLGHRMLTGKGRAHAIIQSTVDSSNGMGDAPYFKMYKGISDFQLPEPRIMLSPLKVRIVAEEIEILQHEGALEGEEEYVDLKHWIEGIDNEFEVIHEQQDQAFNVWQEESNAPRQSDGSLFDELDDNRAPSNEWTTTEDKNLHVGDFLIFGDGSCYKYKNDGTRFYWDIVTDKYLIDAINEIASINNILDGIADDGKVSPQEKPQLLLRWENEKEDYIRRHEEAVTYLTEDHEIVKRFEAKYAALDALMSYVLNESIWHVEIDISDEACKGLTGVTEGFVETWTQYFSAKTEAEMAAKQIIDQKVEKALGEIADMGDDSVLDPAEKLSIQDRLVEITSETATYIDRADIAAASEEKATYQAKYAALITFFADHLSDANKGEYTDVDPVAYKKVWADYFEAREAINEAYHSVMDDVMKDFGDVANDGKITPIEKKQLAIEKSEIEGEYNYWMNIASSLDVSSDAYKAAKEALIGFIDTVIEDEDRATEVDKDEFLGLFGTYSEEKAKLEKAISDKTANNAQELDDMATDKKITKQEKEMTLEPIWEDEKKYAESLIEQAKVYSVSYTAFQGKYNALAAKIAELLTKVDGAYVTTEFTDAENEAYLSLWSEYRTAREALDSAILDAINGLAEDAKKEAEEASHRLDQMANDNVITKEEKLNLYNTWQKEKSDYAEIIATADELAKNTTSINSATLKSKYADLKAMMEGADGNGGLLKKTDGVFSDTRLTNDSGTVVIDFDGIWTAYYLAKANLSASIDRYNKEVADNSEETRQKVNDAAKDRVITTIEKSELKERWESEKRAYARLIAEGSNYRKDDGSTASLGSAIDVLYNVYTTKLAPMMDIVLEVSGGKYPSEFTVDLDLDETDADGNLKIDFDGTWNLYYEKKTALSEEIEKIYLKMSQDTSTSKLLLDSLMADGEATEGEKPIIGLIWSNAKNEALKSLVIYEQKGLSRSNEDYVECMQQIDSTRSDSLAALIEVTILGTSGIVSYSKTLYQELWNKFNNAKSAVDKLIAENDVTKDKLLDAGVNVNDSTITLTADWTKIRDRTGREIAMFKTEKDEKGNVQSVLNTDILNVNKVIARNEYGEKISVFNENGDGTIVYYYPLNDAAREQLQAQVYSEGGGTPQGRIVTLPPTIKQNKMREDVFVYDSDGDVIGMRTLYYDQWGQLSWWITERGSFSNPDNEEELAYYWKQYKAYTMTLSQFKQLATQLGRTESIYILAESYCEIFSEFCAYADSSAAETVNGFTKKGVVANNTNPETLTGTGFTGYQFVDSAIFRPDSSSSVWWANVKYYEDGKLKKSYFIKSNEI